MTKENTNSALRWINAAMSAIAVFLLIGVYNRFEKLVDTVALLQQNQSYIMVNQDMIKKENSMIDASFSNQLKQLNLLMDKINDNEMRLDYLELYSKHSPKSSVGATDEN